MKLEITEKKKNELIGRAEVIGTLVYQGITPSNADITAEIAKQLKVNASLVIVKQIKGVFSKQEAKVTAFAYNDVKAKDKFEMSTKHLRKAAEEKAKKEAEAKQAQAEEKAAADAKKKEEEATASEAKAEPAVESEKSETPKEEKTETPAEAPATE
jgi:ribosomal protein S24E